MNAAVTPNSVNLFNTNPLGFLEAKEIDKSTLLHAYSVASDLAAGLFNDNLEHFMGLSATEDALCMTYLDCALRMDLDVDTIQQCIESSRGAEQLAKSLSCAHRRRNLAKR